MKMRVLELCSIIFPLVFPSAQTKLISIHKTTTPHKCSINYRCRSRGENLDCMGSVTSPHTMEMNGCNRSQQRNSNRENWAKIPEQHNGHSHQVSQHF